MRKEFVFDFSEDTVKTAMDNLLFKQEEALVYAKYNYNKIKYGDNDSQTKNLQSNYNTMAYADRDNIKKSIDKISGYVQKHVVFLKHDLLIKLTDIIDSR
ncbi:MAG: hypothetical protein LBC19_03225, partial [Tannerella sp.]|nr:hypothetical protein [Tannerella sp.]